MSDYKTYSIIIVNYRSKESLAKCLAFVFKNFKSNMPELIVVNNDPDKKLDDLKELYPGLIVINSKNNVGYGLANNLGSRVAKGKYLFFLNPDTEIINVDLDAIAEEFRINDKLGIVGMRIIGSDGLLQSWSVGKELSWIDLVANNISMSRSRSLWDNPADKDVDWVSGTAMIVTREAFFDVGGFDKNFFMYFEDMDLCKRVRNAGKRIVYRPAYIIRHDGGVSYGERTKEQKKDYFRSQDYYFNKHYGKYHMLLLRSLRKAFGK